MTRAIVPDDLFRFRFVVAADLSPDATRVVFAQTRIAPGKRKRKRTSNTATSTSSTSRRGQPAG